MLIMASLILISSLHILDSDHIRHEITQGIIAQEADNYTKDNDYYEGNYGGVQPPQAKKTRRHKYVMARCVENGEFERIKPT